MKIVFMMMLLASHSVFAIDMADLSSQAKGKAQNIMAACKEDKVKFCDKYAEMEALKECLMKNKESLSEGCKSTLGVK